MVFGNRTGDTKKQQRTAWNLLFILSCYEKDYYFSSLYYAWKLFASLIRP